MELSLQGLPILDFSPAINGHSTAALAELVADACQSAGCFYIKNHGVDQKLIDNFFRDLRSFFAQPLDYKTKYQVDFKLDRGYFPFESQNVHAFMGRKNLPNDPVEKLAFGPSTCKYPIPDNLFPDHPPTLKENAENYYESLRNLSKIIMRVFASAAEAPDEDYFYRNCGDAPHSMKGNFYTRNSHPKALQSERLAPHTDVAAVAILAMDDTPKSLRVKNARDEWVFAEPIPGTLFVNLGRPLQRWTNDKWKATEHAVVWPENGQCTDRLSVVFFVILHPDAVIECLPSCLGEGEKAKYEPINFTELVQEYMRALSLGY